MLVPGSSSPACFFPIPDRLRDGQVARRIASVYLWGWFPQRVCPVKGCVVCVAWLGRILVQCLAPFSESYGRCRLVLFC